MDMRFLERNGSLAISPWMGVLKADTFLCGADSGDVADIMIASGVEVVHWLTGAICKLPDRYMAGASGDRCFLMSGYRRH